MQRSAWRPLKRRSSLNTAVGAVSGAMPIVIGWTAVDGAYDLRLAALFTTLYLWQFPHFMAIAWIYRAQYERAGLRMLTVVDDFDLRKPDEGGTVLVLTKRRDL